METIQVMEMNVFFYRNVTLMMNSTRNFEMKVNIDPGVQNRITFISVKPNQTMTLAMNVSGSPPPRGGSDGRQPQLLYGTGAYARAPNAILQLQG